MKLIEALGSGAGVVVAVAAAVAGGLYLARVARDGIRAVYQFARKVDAVMDLAGHELSPNGGNSMKDTVGRIPRLEARIGGLEARLDAHLGRAVHPEDEPEREEHHT